MHPGGFESTFITAGHSEMMGGFRIDEATGKSLGRATLGYLFFLKRGRETLMCERYIDWLSLAHPQLGTWPTTQACALTMQTSTQSIEPHQPGCFGVLETL